MWVDYVSDLGDGFNSTYTVAYLLAQPELEFGGETTQRGRILVMGGDQVYPVPKRSHYENRLLGPYRAAMPNPPSERRRQARPVRHPRQPRLVRRPHQLHQHLLPAAGAGGAADEPDQELLRGRPPPPLVAVGHRPAVRRLHRRGPGPLLLRHRQRRHASRATASSCAWPRRSTAGPRAPRCAPTATSATSSGRSSGPPAAASRSSSRAAATTTAATRRRTAASSSPPVAGGRSSTRPTSCPRAPAPTALLKTNYRQAGRLPLGEGVEAAAEAGVPAARLQPAPGRGAGHRSTCCWPSSSASTWRTSTSSLGVADLWHAAVGEPGRLPARLPPDRQHRGHGAAGPRRQPAGPD